MSNEPRVCDIGEFGLLGRIREILGYHSQEILIGIGDDAAVIQPRTQPVVLSTDAMVEGIHFRKSWTSASDLAYKAMASNLSDLAAKCAEPAYSLITLGLPGATPISWVEEFYNALVGMKDEWGIEVVGGDTVRSETLVVSITVWGYQTTSSPVSQRTARPGDRILVTGTLGDAAAGLELLEGGVVPAVQDSDRHFLIYRFLKPTPRVREAMAIARTALPTAMTDISDGAARDVPKLCEASRVGAVLYGDRFPCSAALREFAAGRAAAYAWKGGEDYELLFTLPPDKADFLLSGWNIPECPLTVIGEIVEKSRGVKIEHWDGEPETGFDHFRDH